MALCISMISDIVPPKLNWQIKVRVLRLWKVHSWNDHNTITSLEMILLDDKCSSIKASVKSALIGEFDSNLEEGFCYIISRVNRHLHPYVIGHVIKKFDMKESMRSGIRVKLLDITLEVLEGNNVDCTLWAEHAEQMNHYLTDNGYDNSIIVILQLCKPKIFQSIHGISNAFHGTKIFINSDLKESLEYKEKLENGNNSLNQVISYVSGQSNNASMDDFLKHPKMNIFEVLQCSKVSIGVVLAKIIDFDHTKKWYYQACTKCAKSVRTKSGELYFCENCVDVLPANPRIKIHVQVADVSGSSTFILFDRVATQELENPHINLFEDNDVTSWPAVFNSLLDKTMLFKIQVSKGNIENKWQSYTVMKITMDQNLIDQFKMKHGMMNVRWHETP
ncbi:uncharacterized protein LOC131645224 [Vicia villosa]|uniref:uncharacterized protein LOC131645224 n=1 Tax=Vicia villosa TaxID=3911 RepID=UPI00273CA4AE|nr:uncharacterized protein LOC131645224 [Vicia villosa]